MSFGIDSVLVLVSGCGLLCTHLWDPVPRFRRHPFSDYGFASVCVCVCVCVCGSNVAVRSFDSRSGICVGVLLWVVVYAPTGPSASFSETPFF